MLIYDKIAVDTSSCTVTYNGTVVQLHPKEYFLLQLFLQFPNQVLSYDAIVGKLWKFDKVPTRSCVRSHIKGLRKAFKKVDNSASIIETVHGLGYRLKEFRQSRLENGDFSQQYLDTQKVTNQNYLVIDRKLVIRELSTGTYQYCHDCEFLEVGNPIQQAFPELEGLESVFAKLLRGEAHSLFLEGIKPIGEGQNERRLSIQVKVNHAKKEPYLWIFFREQMTNHTNSL